ncbi:hypothetical protein TSOC_011512, partial [Tetrabaena socialis]
VLQTERGRGRQLNAGWRAARGEWVLFLHSDSQLPDQYDRHLAAALRGSAAGGCHGRRQRELPLLEDLDLVIRLGK